MNVHHCDRHLERLEFTPGFTEGFSPDVVKAFRKRMAVIRGAKDERDFPNLKSIGFEKLKGGRQHQYSMKLAGAMRLILEFDRSGSDVVVRVVEIENYHRS